MTLPVQPHTYPRDKERDYQMLNDTLTRREFLGRAAAGAAVAAIGTNAASLARAQGSNDRISIGIIGAGGRGYSLLGEIHRFDKEENVEVTAVCDTWFARRDEVAETMKEWYGGEVRTFSDYRRLLDLKDVDAVIIAPPDFAHAIILRDAIRAGKDAYVEKPFATELGEARDAYDAASGSDRIVQVGTQRRSEGLWRAAATAVKSGMLGKISRIEIGWNDVNPRWYRGDFDLTESEVDWKRFLMGKPYRPFNKHQYREWQLFRDFTTGPFALLGTHFFDIVHWYMDDPYPSTAVANGGKYVWNDFREHEDTVIGLLEYPKGFLCQYTTMLGNSTGSGCRIYGTNGMFSDATWTITGTGGGKTAVKEAYKLTAEASEPHTRNWLKCLRSREQPNAPALAGYQHAVANILSYQSLIRGRKLRYVQETRKIVDT